MADEIEVAKLECSDCGSIYYAKLVERNGQWSIGEKVDPPAKGVKVRRQNMLCGDCRGKGGPADKFQNMMDRQRGGSGAMGPGNDPFGLF